MGSLENAESLDVFIAFLLTGFCDLLQKHTVGGELFVKFLVSWYNFVVSIAVRLLCTERSSEMCRKIPELFGISREDRSTLVHRKWPSCAAICKRCDAALVRLSC